MVAVQLGKRMGAKVIADSKDEWMEDFEADYMIKDYDKVVYQVKEITHGKTADIVLNSLGVNTWDSSFESVGVDGRLVTFGGLTGGNVNLNIQSLILPHLAVSIIIISQTEPCHKPQKEFRYS